MPQESRQIFTTRTARFSKTVDAPIRYVYERSTDFRSDDRKFSSSKQRHKMIRLGSDRVVRIGVRVTPTEIPR